MQLVVQCESQANIALQPVSCPFMPCLIFRDTLQMTLLVPTDGPEVAAHPGWGRGLGAVPGGDVRLQCRVAGVPAPQLLYWTAPDGRTIPARSSRVNKVVMFLFLGFILSIICRFTLFLLK